MSGRRVAIAAALFVLLALGTASSAPAATQPILLGHGKNLEFEVRLDAEGVPVRLETDNDWARCPNSYASLEDRVYRRLDAATADSFELRASFSELEAGFLSRVKVHFVGHRRSGNLWEGRYETFVRVFYKGSHVFNCARDKREARWRARQLS